MDHFAVEDARNYREPQKWWWTGQEAAPTRFPYSILDFPVLFL